MLRIYDYVADAKGYRIVKTRAVKVGKKKRKKKNKDRPPVPLDFPPATFKEEVRSNSIEDERPPVAVTKRPVRPLPTRHPRLQRRIGNGKTVAVEPLFNFGPNADDVETETPVVVATTGAPPIRNDIRQRPRNLGDRSRYDPRKERFREESRSRGRPRFGDKAERRRGGAGLRVAPGRVVVRNGRRLRVVKRRRRPEQEISGNTLNYQERKNAIA